MIIKLDEQTSFQVKALAKRANISPEQMVLIAIQLQYAVMHSRYSPEEVLEILKAREPV